MLRVFLFSVSMVCSIHAVAQKTVYYDKFFKSLSESKTPYYRIFNDVDSLIQVNGMCYDTLILKGIIFPDQHRLLANDFVQFIVNNGNPYLSREEFTTMRGEIDFYKDRNLYRKIVSHSGKILHAQIWSKAGDPLLSNGSGRHERMESASMFYEIYQDSTLVEMYEVRQLERDTLYYTYDKMAEPRHGYQQFSNDLVKVLKYPGFARMIGKQGKVYVGFIVDKDGKLTELKPLTNEGFKLEKTAVNKLSKMPNWQPATFRGKPVKMRFVIPMNFRLTK